MSPVTHRAKWVIISPESILENGFVTVKDGRIVETGKGRGRPQAEEVDHGAGILMPATVNAHTHLDLSSLGKLIPAKSGFLPWVRGIVRQKRNLTDEDIDQGLSKGIEELKSHGCALAGDHRSFPGHSKQAKWPLVHTFREYLGKDQEVLIRDLREEGYFSVAGHAPHTTSPSLIRRLKHKTLSHSILLSLHLAESYEEKEFISTGKGVWADFLKERGIDYSSWGLPARSPVLFLDRLGVLDEKTLAVHLVQVEPEDLDIIATGGSVSVFVREATPDWSAIFLISPGC